MKRISYISNQVDESLAEGGRSRPLGIVEPVFVVRQIDQSSMAPCATNLISVTLQVNVPLAANTSITIAGLTHSQTPDNEALALTDLDGGCYGNSAAWTKDGTLVLTVADPLEANETCAFEILLANPVFETNPVPPTVHATICNDCEVVRNTMNGLALKVSALHFDAHISQSSPFPCDENTITVLLSHKTLSGAGYCTMLTTPRAPQIPLYGK